MCLCHMSLIDFLFLFFLFCLIDKGCGSLVDSVVIRKGQGEDVFSVQRNLIFDQLQIDAGICDIALN